jgi:KDO2-lipid IV(A) lauroyltransferase
MGILYVFSDVLHFFLYRVIGYRKAVVMENLRGSFPEKSEDALRNIAKAFYRHLGDLIIESLRQFSISEREMRQRFQVANPEIMERLYAQGKNVAFVAGHYNNWELASTALPLRVPNRMVGIYAPLKNKFFNNILVQSRSRFGLELLPKGKLNIKTLHEESKRPYGLMFAMDQSPSSANRVHWVTFLNRETAVASGTEWFAKQFDAVVVFAVLEKVRRGHYRATLEILEDRPKQAPESSISARFTQRLEAEIRERPEFWLWTHRRWKRKRQG